MAKSEFFYNTVSKEYLCLRGWFQKASSFYKKPPCAHEIFIFTSERAWHRFVVENLLQKRHSLSVLDTIVVVARYVGWLNGFDINSQTWTISRVYHCRQFTDLCHYTRTSRIKRFRDVADIRYRAFKKMFFYGFKMHIQIAKRTLVLCQENRHKKIEIFSTALRLLALSGNEGVILFHFWQGNR